MLRIVVALALLAVNASCEANRVAAEQAVYEAILVHRDFTSELGPQLLVATSLARPLEVMRGHIPDPAGRADIDQLSHMGLSQALVDAFSVVAERHGEMPPGVAALPGVSLIPEAREGGGSGRALRLDRSFLERYPGHQGFIRLSPVAFNAAKTEALVLATVQCMSLCGHGDALVLHKAEGGWRVVDRKLFWIS